MIGTEALGKTLTVPSLVEHTIVGAQACGLERRVGSLTVGRPRMPALAVEPQSALYPRLDALGSRNLIEGRRKSAVQGRVPGVTAGAGTPFAFRSMVCLSVAAATSVL
jgi:hypothetical protein